MIAPARVKVPPTALATVRVLANPSPAGSFRSTNWADVAGFALPAVAAQEFPLRFHLALPGIQWGSAIQCDLAIVAAAEAGAGAPAASQANCWLWRHLFGPGSVAFATHPVDVFSDIVAAGVALPATKLRWKVSADNGNNTGVIVQKDGLEPTYGTLTLERA